MKFNLHLGDCLATMRAMPDASVDSIVTDPPYGLEFMGKEWDGADGFRRSLNANDAGRESTFGRMSKRAPEYRAGKLFQEWCEAWAIEALRVLKPGGHLLAFSGSRTYHRMTCAIEDAGFEVRDQIMWVYGSGFPKSRNLDGAHEGWGTALKPAHEPICVARKPLIGTVAANVLAHGTGALNIDACRVATSDTPSGGGSLRQWRTMEGRADLPEHTPNITPETGRWPANLIHDGSDEVVALFPESNGSGPARTLKRSAKDDSNGWGMNTTAADSAALPDAGTGSAARFFYCAKTSKKDRDEGMQTASATFEHGTTLRQIENAPKTGNHHPTVKPTDLMAYLCRLVTPPGGTILDPFMGSGSTGKAAMREGFRFIGIDMTPEYVEIARARIGAELAKQQPVAPVPVGQLDLLAAL